METSKSPIFFGANHNGISGDRNGVRKTIARRTISVGLGSRSCQVSFLSQRTSKCLRQ